MFLRTVLNSMNAASEVRFLRVPWGSMAVVGELLLMLVVLLETAWASAPADVLLATLAPKG